VSLEHPQLWGGLIDLEPQAPAADETEMLWQLLANQQQEDHLALRGENTYVARLVNKDTPEFSQDLSLSSDGSYLITGGLGALGLHTAQWLVEKGAKNIVLTGRRPPTEKVSESIKQLEETGCQVRVLLGDVSVEADIGRILEQIQTSMPALKGIIHAAGVLDDGTIQQMNWGRFAQVMSPKLIGTWHLHTLTQNLPLDFFVCFSSIASMLGSPGQGNYAAANAFMDALASHRRSQGLSGLAINWGAWASEGMAARLAVEHQSRMQSSGITEIAPKEGMSALDLLLTNKSATAQVGVAGIQWQVLAESWSSMKTNSLLRELLQQEEWFEEDTRKQKVKGEFLAKLEAASNEKRQEILTGHIRKQVAQVLGFSSSKLPEVNVGLMEMGMDSLMTVELKNRLQNQLGTNLPETIAIEYPTIAKLSLYIEELMGWKTTEIDPSSEETETKLMMERSRTEAIAIIGIGCRFPRNANTPESFWELLSNGQDSITEIPLERWDLDSYYDPNPESPGKMYIRHAALVEQVDQFDPQFFGISDREAHSLDPQQRFILEVTWEALERAGINPQKLENTQTGVFLGIGQNDYANLGFRQAAEDISPYDATGNGFCFVAGRLSYFLGVQGPSLAIDTACSSSLVAIHEACQSLRHGESNLALAGGVQLILSPEVTTALSKLKALAPDGKCKTFDAAADGYGRGEGCGIVVLKRLSDALKDGDRISAVIRGSAVNHDGPSSGMTVPNKLAQEKLIQKALKAAKVEPLQVSYVEAHGTGTSLGDPMEVRALARVFDQGREGENILNIGSVKTNIGHLEAAAGIAGIIKVILQLQHQEIAPHLHLANLNPYIDWENMPLKVPTQLTPWLSKGEKRVAGVSSFGMSGTNAHIVLEEAPSIVIEVKNGDHKERPIHLLTLSGKTEKALEDLVSNYQNYLETNPELALGDICYTASTGRAHFNHRLGVMASEPTELIKKLLGWKTDSELVGVFSGKPNSESPKIAFLFTGQGSQYINMGRQLYEQAPTFRQALEQCDQILQPYLETSILEIIYPKDAEKSSLLDQTAYTQPAIFALEYALFKLWDSWGIKPNVVMGHSVGEYVAACIAGVFSLEDGLKLIAMRGKLMQKLPSGGEMVSVMASESQVTEAIKEYTSQVTIAAVNGPESIVISGESGAMATICDMLKNMGIKTKKLQVSHAFHSPLMEPMLTEFEAVAKQVTYNEPKIPLISNVTGTEVGAEITVAEYWVAHVRQPVKFAQGMKTLEEQGYETFLEIGPKPILLGMGRRCVTEDVGEWLPSLRPNQIPLLSPLEREKSEDTELLKDEWQQMLSSLGKLYVKGVKIDWSGFDSDYNRHKVALPTYPFQRGRYWVEAANSQTISATKLHPLINRKFQSPLSKEIFFESEFSTHNLPFLVDHRIYEKVVVPGASHISLLLAAASLTFSTTGCQLEDILFPQALAIPEQGVRNVQVALTPQDSSYSFQVISFDSSSSSANGSSSWAVHTTGKISPSMESSQHSLESIKEIQSRCRQQVESAEIYQAIWDTQIHLGESFRWIDQVWLGEEEVLCQMKVPETVLDVLKYQIHPALIDSCFQSVAALNLSLAGNKNETFVPFSIEKFTFYRGPENGLLWCYTRGLKEGESESKLQKAEIRLFDQSGALVAEVNGFEGRKANLQTLLRTLDSDLSDWFYEINWKAQSLTKILKSDENAPGKWLIFALSDELLESIGKYLQQRGQNYIWVSPGSEYQQLDAQHYQMNPTVAEQFPKLLQDNSDIKGILHLWGINETEDLQTAQELSCATTLHLLQALVQAGLSSTIPMWLVTQGTQNVFDAAEVVEPLQGSLWGLGRVISLEHPELKCGRIDLDPTSNFAEMVPSLVNELFSEENEDQIAIRQGVRYVARLVRQQKPKISSGEELGLENQPVELKLSEYGLIDKLNWQVMQRRLPQENEVEIRVKAAGLNFRDVLNSLGLLKDYYTEVLGITDVAQLNFGLECVGVIASVGKNVSQWQVGDEVMAIVHNGFSSFVTTGAELVMAKPKNLSFTEAATLPLTFATAYYGLQHLAKIQPGERVLIHAAAGGVGQAAVQIALGAGAEVFATASPPKWEFLKSMGIKHIMNSRTLDFADEIMSITQGKGVDIVLNSLNGDFIDKSFAVLGTKGRFVEIGKIGIWDKQKVMEKRPDADYLPFDIGLTIQQQPGLMAEFSEKLNQQCQLGKLKALSYKVFPNTEIKGAFRYMQQGKHIGKVVVSLPKTGDEEKSIKSEASYLITGGLGALGLEVAQWMVQEGAKNIVLTGRRSPNEGAQKVIEELEATGASVSVLLGDISTQESVIKILEGISTSLPPLKGVIHGAGVLDDGVLQKMNWEKFTKVMAPKVSGTWYLHQLTQDLPLDFFVCFSSMASMLGNYGQGNYAAANGFMDAIAHYRQGQGLPGLSINWGAWATAGMAARLAKEHQNRMQSSGVMAIEAEPGMQALGSLLSGSQSQVGVFPVNWWEFFRQMPGLAKLPFLEAFTAKSVEENQNYQILEQLNLASDGEQEKLLTSYLQRKIAHIMGMTVSQIELEKSLTMMGLDSLMAVELRNQIQTELGADIPATRFMEGITIELLATEVKEQLIIQTDQNQTLESNNQEQLDQNKDNNWIEVEL
jgi:malonyl CoA-acyl carrier protein transacylase